MISSVELAEKTFTGINLPRPYTRVLGKVPENFSMAIWGPPGSGKSTVAVDLAYVLANVLGKGIYCSSEEGAGPSMQNKIKRLKADHPDLFITDFDGIDDLKSAIKYSKAKFCVFDSASMSHIKVSEMEDIHDFCKKTGVAFIYILHATKTGDYKGNSFLIHMPDTVLHVQDGIAKTTKNRFADTPQEFEVNFETKDRENPFKNDSGDKVIRIKKNFFGRNITVKSLQKKAAEYSKDKLAGLTVTNLETGIEVKVSWQGLKKAISGRFSNEKLLSIPNIPDMIEKGVYLGKEKDQKKRNTIKAVHKFSNELLFDEEKINSVLVVRETTSGTFYYDHIIIGNKKPDGVSGERNQDSNSDQPTSGVDSKDTKNSGNRENPALNENCLCGLEYIENPEEDKYRENKGVSPEEIYQTITDRIINTIKEKGHLPWQKEWKETGLYGGRIATNFVSKKPYRGINYFLLNFELKMGKSGAYMVPRKLKNPYFLTFNQVNKLEGKIKKGSKGEMVIYFTRLYSYRQIDPVELNFSTKDKKKMISWLNKHRADIDLFRDGFTAEEIASQSYIPVLKYYNVFNGENIEGIDWGKLPENDNAERPEAEKIQVAEAIIEAFPNQPEIKHDQPKAFYTPAGDFINMPKLQDFTEPQYYYSTLFHESVHSTGHQSRVGRDLSGRFGTEKYAFEELIAEMGAVYLCGESGILFRTIDNSAKYLKNWNNRLIKKMKEDNKFYFRAASKAQEATDYILDRDQEGVPAYLKSLNLDEVSTEEKAEIKPSVQPIGISGKQTAVDFKADGSEKHKGYFQLIEAADLTSSHNKDCSANSKHRISRGQPRDRSLDNLCAQPKFIAKNLNPESITNGNLAFQGAPVTTVDGMVIQGNGRSIALKIAYDEIEKSAEKYKKYLASNAKQFGFIADDVNGMNKPVLVRMLDVDDEEAVRLGNVVDTSQAKMNRIDQAKAIIRGLKFNQLEVIGRIIGSSQGETIGAIIDDIGIQLFDQVKDLDRTGLIEKNELTADGKEFLRSVLTGIIFDAEEHKNALRDYLSNSRTIQAGIERSFGSIIPLMNTNGDIRSQIQQAVSITAEIKRNDAFDSVDDVMSSQDIFSGAKTYKQESQDLARFLLSAKTQKAIRDGFRVYADYIRGRDDLFNPIKATSQKEAFKAAFIDRKNPPEELVKLLTPKDFQKGDIIRDYYDNVKYSIQQIKGNTYHLKNVETGKKETFKSTDKRFLPDRKVTPTLSLFRDNPEPLAFMGITEKITIGDGSQVKELRGNFPTFLSGDKLYIIPTHRVKKVKNKVDSKKAVQDFETFHNYNASDTDYKIDFPEEKSIAVGTAQKIWYASDKVIQEGDQKGKTNHYVHDFDAGKRPAVVKGDVLIIGNIEWDARGLLN